MSDWVLKEPLIGLIKGSALSKAIKNREKYSRMSQVKFVEGNR